MFMLLLVGLGNPGARYAGNRHNVGFLAVQEIAKRHGLGPWRRRFAGVACEGPLGGVRTLLLLPGTYMNESGRGDKDLVQHYVLNDFAKSDRGWVEALIAIIGENADLIARGQDASFQNKVHLAMVAKGFGQAERDEETSDGDSK
jgi:peptidyl-tRNA hydrolase